MTSPSSAPPRRALLRLLAPLLLAPALASCQPPDIVVHAAFIGRSLAFVAADRLTLTRQAAEGDKRAARALTVQERLSFMLSGAQLGITVTGLVVGFLAEPSLARLLDPALDAVGLPAAAAHGVALAAAFILANRAGLDAPGVQARYERLLRAWAERRGEAGGR